MPPKKARRASAPSVAQLFYAGHYAEIVRQRVDSAEDTGSPADLPFLVGALAFVGRLEEARARALSGGERRSKDELLRVVWGIKSYRPDAHDPVIHTAVSRLRALLGVRGHWIEAASGGYQLAAGVSVMESFSGFSAPADSPLVAEEAPRPSAPPAVPPARPSSPGPAPSASSLSPELDAIVSFLVREGSASSTDVATRLGVSEMTALRRLRDLVDQGVVSRSGKGKNTRYRAGSSS